MTEEAAFRVELEQFSGPLDLLVHLLREDELEPAAIPVARVCDRYLEHLGDLGGIDIDAAGDFLVMASILMKLKARALLPEAPEAFEEDELDPRFELVRQLVQYRRFKQVADALRERRLEAALRLERGSHPEIAEATRRPPSADALQSASVEGLFGAFSRLLRETQVASGYVLTHDDTPLEVHVERLGACLVPGERMPFPALFGERRDRGWVIGVFLALLELMKRGLADVLQAGDDDEIVVLGRAGPAPPAAS